MIRIGPIIIVKARDYPFLERAHKLARAITDGQIQDLLEGRRHVHRNPPRKKREAKAERQENERGSAVA